MHFPTAPFTLVFVPGMQCTEDTFAPVVNYLRGRFGERVPTTIRPVRAYSLEEAVDDLLGTGDRIVPVGHSLGGTVALAAARLAPHRVPALATVCANPRGPRPTQRAAWNDQISRVARGELAGCIDEVLPQLVGDASPDLAARVRAMMEATGELRYLQQLQIQHQRIDERPALADFDGPVLAVAAENDRLIPVPVATEIADTAPRGTSTVVPGAGHMLPLEQPATVAIALGSWVEQLLDSYATALQ
ncbi:alpha/beta fold hydrolase [Rhodococcus indonesiensis]